LKLMKRRLEARLFRVKGFPYLIVTTKLNRIEFCGYQCQRIETFFDYPAIRESDYRERISKQKLEIVKKAFHEQSVKLNQWKCSPIYTQLLEQSALAQDLAAGLKKVFDSYQGKPEALVTSSAGMLTLFLSAERDCLELNRDCQELFGQWSISLEALQPARAYLEQLPELLKPVAYDLFDETVFDHLSAAFKLLDAYESIHGEQIFRVYLRKAGQNTINPILIYHYLPKLQQQLATVKNQLLSDLNGKCLWQYDLSGKNWPNLKISNADLRRVNFDAAQLTKAEFSNCDLTDATFRKADLKQVKFSNCLLRRTIFDRADLREAELTGSDLYHCSFAKSNLREGKIKNERLEKAYFFQTILFDAVVEAPGDIFDCVFRLGDLRGAKVVGAPEEVDNTMSNCDFRNADLTGCCLDVYRVSKGNFSKTVLNHTLFANCDKITLSNFRWAACVGLHLGQIEVYNCDFSFVDLSRMKTMKGALFVGNNFTHTNLSRYSFKTGYWLNKLVETDLSDCNLEGVDFSNSYLIFPNFKGAILKGARFREGQLQYIKNLSSMQGSGIKVITGK
jgi:uncharacterized protein YjbI with pentapeptide repeats